MSGAETGSMMAFEEKLAGDRMPSAREQLTRKKQNLERQLEDVNAAIQALDDHPDVEKVLTLVGRTVRF